MAVQPVPTCRQYRLFIAGSRQATDAMLRKAYQTVVRARAKGWCILVGDAPTGVDAVVMTACNQLRVNYLCCGISQQPRAATYRDIQHGGTGRYRRFASTKSHDYAARDRFLADLADRGLFLWNGESKGTAQVYRYMRSLQKPADLLTFAAQQQAIISASKTATSVDRPPAPIVVEVIISTTIIADTTEGVFGLRALDGSGHVPYQTRETLRDLQATTPDYAKMIVLIRTLERLKTNLKGRTAPYSLRIVQSSKNVEGWLHHGWKRNTEPVQQFGRTADALLKHFPATEWVKMPHAQVASCLAKITPPAR